MRSPVACAFTDGGMTHVPTGDQLSAITLFTDDLAVSRSFYEDVLELPCIFEDESSAAFRLGPAIVNLLAIPAAGELIYPGVVANRGSGATFVLTIEVDDVDARCAQLATRKVTLLNGPIDREWGVRTVSFADPSGHIWEFAQELPADGR